MSKHGAQDWSKYRITAPSFPIDDLGELAVRLGAIAVSDRRGEVSFVESFEYSTRNWTITSTPVGGTLTLSPTYARHGGYSLKATTPAASPNVIAATHREPPIYAGRVGIELLLYLGQNITSIAAQFDHYDGSRHYRITATSLATALLSDSWNILKAVVDLDTHFAVRQIINGTETDTSAIPFTDVGASSDHYLEAVVAAIGTGSLEGILYIDAVAITRDEP